MTENEISYKCIGVAIEIHKSIGPGLLESVYENALTYDFYVKFLAKAAKQKHAKIAKPLRPSRKKF